MLSIDFSHEKLSCCRAFMYPVGYAVDQGWQNLSPLWRFPIQNGLDAASAPGQSHGGHPSILTGAAAPGAGTTYAVYSYWNDIWPDDAGNDITVIARMLYRGGDPGGGSGSFVCGARGSGNNGGFLFGVWDAGGSDEGLAVFMYSHSGVWVFTDQQGFTDVIDRPIVAAFVYQSGDQRLTMYRNGVPTRSATNTGSVWKPFVNESNKQFFIGRADAGFVFPGEIGWIMVFARALTPADIEYLSRDTEWGFVGDELPLSTASISYTYTTTVYVGSEVTAAGGGGSEAATYRSGVIAEAFLDGDLVSGPQPVATATYRTAVVVASTMRGSEPQLVVYRTTVNVDMVYTNSAPVLYVTTVTVTSNELGLVDGRADLIGNVRYRR